MSEVTESGVQQMLQTCFVMWFLQLDPESDEAKKKAEADRLRAAEKFMTIGTGKALCVSCGYEYEEKRGDPEYPITPGTRFQVTSPAAHLDLHVAAGNTMQVNWVCALLLLFGLHSLQPQLGACVVELSPQCFGCCKGKRR